MPEGPSARTDALPLRRTYVRTFLIRVSLVLVLFITLAFTGMYLRTRQLIAEGALTAARSYVDLIITARDWNSHYGGVYVDKAIAGPSNPYLLRLGVKPDITTTDGRAFTLRNPALMTREISEMLATRGGVTFRLTSLDPVNPANAADPWERSALLEFAKGATEQWVATSDETTPVLRYIRPLITQESCLACHASQGSRAGDIRGGLSVTVPLDAEGAALRDNALALAAFGLLSTIVLLGLTYLFVNRMSARLEEAEAALVRMATIDELTGISNRRHAFSRLKEELERSRRTGTSLCVVMVDIDWFKRVNDTFGHATGDHALAEVAGRIERSLRPYDLVGRTGGEEFLIIAPSADLEEGAALAQRLREAVATRPIQHEGHSVDVSISLGVALARPAEPDALDRALARADRALYAAKAGGRNRVEVEAEPEA